MNLPNIHFEDTLIEFKEINPSDFNEHYSVDEKIIINPDDESGYLDKELKPIFEKGFNEKSTVVLNAGVGQGKTYTVINQIAEYANCKDFVVIVAVPFKNLIEQYSKDISKKINKKKIFNILDIDDVYIDKPPFMDNIFMADEYNVNKFDASEYSVHIMTINSLLGNAGDSLLQARNKVIYINKLRKHCEESNKRIVIFFDEIHDGIHNFHEEYLYKFWNLHEIIQKIFIISATFNEASKEVIKYLSEFTDRKIQIIESTRKRFPKKQSNLNIYFYSGYNIDQDVSLLNLIKSLKNENKDFDMMVYSKNLIKKFLESPMNKSKTSVSHLLYPMRDNINRCYYDVFDKTNANKKYNGKFKINIGTNFSTGINIEKINHNYLIILPKDLNIDFFNNKGVFTNGSNTIIQTFARLRKKGNIHIFMPFPLEIAKDSLPFNDSQNNIFHAIYDEYIYDRTRKVSYSNINKQSNELTKIYNSLYSYVSKARTLIANTERNGMNRLLYPSKEIFIMNKGERFLSENYFGGNLSSYVFFASITNQFLNCRLTNINYSNLLNLSTSNFEIEIKEIFDQEIDFLKSIWNFQSDSANYLDDFSNERNIVSPNSNHIEFGHNLSDFELYEYFEKYFFKTFEILLDGKRLDILKKDKVRKQLLLLIYGRKGSRKKELYHKYLKSCIYYSNMLEIDSIPENIIPSKAIEIIELFKHWYDFVELLEQLKVFNKQGNILPSETPPEFKKLFVSKSMINNINELRKKEAFLSTDVFPFKNTFGKLSTQTKMGDSFYKLLINVLYDGELKSSTLNRESIRRYILKDIDFEKSKLINLLHKPLPEFIL